MSTIIRRAARAARRVALVLAIWMLVMVAMPFVGPSGRQIAIVGPGGRSARVIAAAGGRIVEVRRGATIGWSDDPGFVRALYAAGAPLVIEGRIAAGCFSKKGA